MKIFGFVSEFEDFLCVRVLTVREKGTKDKINN